MAGRKRLRHKAHGSDFHTFLTLPKIGELAAVIMYDNMTPGDSLDDAVIAIRHTGFFDAGGGAQ